MRRLVVVLAAVGGCGLLAVTGIAATGAPGGDPAPAGFQLADGSAGCALLEPALLACRTAGIDAAVVLDRDGSSRVERLAVEWDRETPVLRPTQSWWHAGFVCRVQHGRVHCAAGNGSIAAGRSALAGSH